MNSPSFKLPPPASAPGSTILRYISGQRLNVLQKYLLVQNLFLAGLCLGVGACIYLLQDLVENLDRFVESGVGVGVMIAYFLAKLPLILSQILPAVFLVALIVQIGLLVRHRELLALQSGGVSYGALVRFFAVYGFAWCLFQLLLSQGLAVAGQRTMDRIWEEKVLQQTPGVVEIENVWFLNGPYIVSVDRALPGAGTGSGVAVYTYGEGNVLREIIVAETFVAREREWLLQNVRLYDVDSFDVRELPTHTLAITQDLDAFSVLQARFDPAALSLIELGRIIAYLEGTGSNVERLRTAWHMKWSYAFSLLVMVLIALALYTIFDSVYVNIAIGLAIVFVYYVLFVLGVSLGERGFLSPLLGAWLGNILFALSAGGRLLWHFVPGDPLKIFQAK
ncbi:LptF/LptG family permease [Desulfonatronum thioautotrophicum]|uniref:LptF/LptG family permease n=1 Tax=Desulfonatronum thioautotrophicum TaxID=617001 RepID=UPI00069A2348|nr:LptF/LptG family permease [Desulfonatronum thioautotrophicum]